VDHHKEEEVPREISGEAKDLEEEEEALEGEEDREAGDAAVLVPEEAKRL